MSGEIAPKPKCARRGQPCRWWAPLQPSMQSRGRPAHSRLSSNAEESRAQGTLLYSHPDAVAKASSSRRQTNIADWLLDDLLSGEDRRLCQAVEFLASASLSAALKYIEAGRDGDVESRRVGLVDLDLFRTTQPFLEPGFVSGEPILPPHEEPALGGIAGGNRSCQTTGCENSRSRARIGKLPTNSSSSPTHSGNASIHPSRTLGFAT